MKLSEKDHELKVKIDNVNNLLKQQQQVTDDKSRQISNLTSQVTKQQNDIKNLTNQMNVLKNDINDMKLSEKDHELKVKIDNVNNLLKQQQQVTDDKSRQISNLTSQVTKQQNDIKNLTNQMNVLKN
eukprot:314521_1